MSSVKASIGKVVKEVSSNSLGNNTRKYSKRTFLSTDYGKLLCLNTFGKKQKKSGESVLNSSPSTTNKEILSPEILFDIEYISDNTSANYLVKNIKEKKDKFLFKPNSHFGNTIELYKATRKKINENIFGTKKKPENPFRNCKTSYEVFHLSRNLKSTINNKLSRIGYMLLKNGEVNINHKDTSILQNNINIISILKEFITLNETANAGALLTNDKFSKHDYFLPARIYEGVISANSYIQKGIAIRALGEKKIYTLYGVFSPTRQDYIDLLNDFFKNNFKDLKYIENAIDLGCGTGVLSFLAAQYGIKKVFAVDSLKNCITSTISNSQTLDCTDKIHPILMDLVEKYKTDKKKDKGVSLDTYRNALLENKIEPELDLVICNPPWLNASYAEYATDIENSIYDPSHAFLKSAFNFASIHLNRRNPNSRFLLLFSDLGSILNINEHDLIEKLSKEYNLNIVGVTTSKAEVKIREDFDPLKNYKRESVVQLYEIKRV